MGQPPVAVRQTASDNVLSHKWIVAQAELPRAGCSDARASHTPVLAGPASVSKLHLHCRADCHIVMLALLARQQSAALRQVLPAVAQAALLQQERGMKLFKVGGADAGVAAAREGRCVGFGRCRRRLLPLPPARPRPDAPAAPIPHILPAAV